MSILRLENVSKHFILPDKKTKLEILSDINMEVVKGQSVSIIGKSGSGKSTLLSIAALIDNPSSGHIYINDEEISNFSDSYLAQIRRAKMGFVFQNSMLLEDFNARENIAFPLKLLKMNTTDINNRVDELLEKLDLTQRALHRPYEMSGGEKQRVAIARAIASKPELIFADEPTGALDEESSQIIEKTLLDLVKDSSSTLILVTHNLNFAKLCDTCITLTNKGLVF